MRCLLILTAICLLSISAFASDEPFASPSNWGGTGLMETPTARVIGENRFRLGFSMINPYWYYYVTMSPFNGLEIGGRISEIRGVPGFSFESAYGNYKDKAFDFKYQIIPEDKYTPSVAFGVMDPIGSRLYTSQYIVASKQIYPFDFTLGLGNGRLGKKTLPSAGEKLKLEILSDPKGWLTDSQFFWGIQFAPSEKYALMVEYSPILYHKQTQDRAQSKFFREPVPLKYNFGFRYKPVKWAELDLSYQRGNQFAANLSLPFNIGNPMIPIYDHPYKEAAISSLMPLEYRLVDALAYSGFSNIGIKQEGSILKIDLQNNKYFYNMRALGVALTAITPVIHENIEEVVIIFKETGVPMFSFQAKTADMIEFQEGRITLNEFLFLSKFNTESVDVPESEKWGKDLFTIGYKPQLQLFLNDPSGFWKGKIGVSGWASYPLWRSGFLIAGIGLYPFASISTINEPLSIPVRSDIVNYIKHKLLFERFFFEQTNRWPGRIFTRFASGILETEYSGGDAEAASYMFDGKIMYGVSGSVVKKRDPDNPILFKRDDAKNYYTTAFFNTRINFSAQDISFDIKYGRFLAGDIGTRFTISKFISGVILSAWYSVVDTSVFKDSSNRGYHDKGVAFSIPMRLFEGRDTRAVYGQAISPWTRDVAQDIDHFNSLFDFIGRNTKIFINKDKNKMYP